MHILAYTVACQLAHYTVAMTGAMVLYSAAYIAYMSTGNSSLDAQIESLLGGLEQPHHIIGDLAHWERVCAVGVKTVQQNTAVDGDDIAILEYGLFRRYTVYHLLVDRGATSTGKTLIALAGGYTSGVANIFLGDSVQLSGSHTRHDVLCHFGVSLRQQDVTLPHELDLFVCLQINHLSIYLLVIYHLIIWQLTISMP